MIQLLLKASGAAWLETKALLFRRIENDLTGHLPAFKTELAAAIRKSCVMGDVIILAKEAARLVLDLVSHVSIRLHSFGRCRRRQYDASGLIVPERTGSAKKKTPSSFAAAGLNPSLEGGGGDNFIMRRCDIDVQLKALIPAIGICNIP